MSTSSLIVLVSYILAVVAEQEDYLDRRINNLTIYDIPNPLSDSALESLILPYAFPPSGPLRAEGPRPPLPCQVIPPLPSSLHLPTSNSDENQFPPSYEEAPDGSTRVQEIYKKPLIVFGKSKGDDSMIAILVKDGLLSLKSNSKTTHLHRYLLNGFPKVGILGTSWKFPSESVVSVLDELSFKQLIVPDDLSVTDFLGIFIRPIPILFVFNEDGSNREQLKMWRELVTIQLSDEKYEILDETDEQSYPIPGIPIKQDQLNSLVNVIVPLVRAKLPMVHPPPFQRRMFGPLPPPYF
uniref:(California timema) hypothetical protein n=1 Tax=Timema californicum TaxID=61474 RepID=A0A7R9JF76_TIMCA|nr:unnamed protein product [Timema californicum]